MVRFYRSHHVADGLTPPIRAVHGLHILKQKHAQQSAISRDRKSTLTVHSKDVIDELLDRQVGRGGNREHHNGLNRCVFLAMDLVNDTLRRVPQKKPNNHRPKTRKKIAASKRDEQTEKHHSGGDRLAAPPCQNGGLAQVLS